MSGRVYLVGAGPGDPGLLTARALELIAKADTILYDRLIPEQALEGARPDAELLFVGKQGGGDSVPQEQTEKLMIERALMGREVVRLKGGDPFVFGRGGEEALALCEAGIPFEVVPGVTAGVAAPAYAGIPVTHRGLSTAVAFITGHTREDAADDDRKPGEQGDEQVRDAAERPGQDSAQQDGDIDWSALAAFPGTLVFYMGVRRLAQIADSLIAAGRSAEQPAAVVERGTFADQRTVAGTLGTIATLARDAHIKAPSITIVGAVAKLGSELSWLADRPLAGRTIAVTRARAQASELAGRLRELGATVVQAPVIRTSALPGPPIDPAPYDLICLTSPNGVDALFARLDDGVHPPGDARSLANARIAVIGPGTARALGAYGIEADIVPERFVAEGLVEALEQTLADGPVQRVLIARASEARDVLPDALRARGAEVDVMALYETAAEPLSENALKGAREADYITFTSSSTVRFFLAAAGVSAGAPASAGAEGRGAQAHGATRGGVELLSPGTRIVSIGPVTSATLREHGLEPDVEAERHDIDGLLDALLADAAALASSRER